MHAVRACWPSVPMSQRPVCSSKPNATRLMFNRFLAQCRPLGRVMRDACAARRLWRAGLVLDLLTRACSVLYGESSKRLAPPRNTKDRKHLQSTQTTVDRHNSQTKHLVLSKGQLGSQDTQHQSAQQPCTPSAQQPCTLSAQQPCTPSAQQPPAINTHTQLGHHQILSANAACCEAQAS